MGLLPALGIVQLEFQGVAMGSVYYPLDIFYSTNSPLFFICKKVKSFY